MKKTIIYSVLLLNILMYTTKCIGQEHTDERVIRSFLNQVLTSDTLNMKEMEDQYMAFEPYSDSLTLVRRAMFQKHLTITKETYVTSYDATDTKIVPYKKLKREQQLPFKKEIVNDVYTVFFKDSKPLYFYLENHKIKAFDLYMIKGGGESGVAYFITY